MAVKVKKRTGLDDFETIAVWEDGEWIEGDAPFLEDEHLQEYDKDQILNHFTGPDLFAVIGDTHEQSTLTEVTDGS